MNDWRQAAKWIWLEEAGKLNQYADFRCKFSVGDDLNAIRLFISADSRYAAFINGRYVPLSQYSDYPQNKSYDSLDITEWIHSGENVLAVVGYYQGEDSLTYRLGKAGLLFAVTQGEEILAASGENTLCRPSCCYKSGEMERFTLQLSFSFSYDADLADDWTELSYNAGDEWKNACVLPQNPTVYPRPIKNLFIAPRKEAKIIAQGLFLDNERQEKCGARMQHAFLSAMRSKEMGAPSHLPKLPCEGGIDFTAEGGDGIYLLADLGREEAGLIDLELTLPCFAEILIGFGEHLEDLRVRTEIDGRQFAAVYKAKSGHQRFTHYFKRVGCRYLMLYIYAKECRINYMGVLPVSYPLLTNTHFKCNDSLHNKIYEVSRRTLELCMHEHYEDCPWREQALYAMDSRNQMLFGYYAFGETEFAQASLSLLAEGIREDGLLELCAPARWEITIPVFSLAFIQALGENIAYSGNKSFAKKMLPVAEKIMKSFLSRRDDNGLIKVFPQKGYWEFYEWCDGLDGVERMQNGAKEKTYDLPLNAWAVIALKELEGICDFLDLRERALKYREERESLSAATEQFWNPEKQCYATYLSNGALSHYCQLTQSLMVYSGAVPEIRIDGLLEKLFYDEELIPVSISHSIYKYDALMKRPDKYGSLVVKEIGNIWGDMLFKDSTSFWETEIGADDFDYAGSLCHGWSAVPLYIYHRYVMGERIDGKLQPVYCGLELAK